MPLSCYQIYPPSASASQAMDDEFRYAGHTIFNDALDVFTIQKETAFGSKVFEDVKVRITSVINTSTGTKLSDDFKQLIFDPISIVKPRSKRCWIF